MKKTMAMIMALITVISALSACAGNNGEGGSQSTSESLSESIPFSPDMIELSASAAPADGTGAASETGEIDSDVLFKAEYFQNNPLLTNVFCADPTSVEYDGRLYVYGTRDHQQYLEKGDSDNTYEKIKSFVIISTDDMVNWRYEGEINTAAIAPWIIASWAPSITSRVEDDGKTHFYLYFSNSGAGVGVLTATHPAGPWSDPLGKPLIEAGMEGLNGCPNPFDPGVVIDDEGTGWLSFGGGTVKGGSKYMPGSTRIVRLGEDMLSLASEIAEIPAPYFFEASELNYFGGTYVYTYNNSWESRYEWDKDCLFSAPPACSMSYMTTKTPLDPESWEYRGHYLRNPGELNMNYSNNHTHLHKFNDRYYLFYHTLILQSELGITKGFRSIGANEIAVNEEKVIIENCNADRTGLSQTKYFDPYAVNQAETAFLTDTEYKVSGNGVAAYCSGTKVIGIRSVDFGQSSKAFAAKVSGKGTIEIRLDTVNSPSAAAISFDSSEPAVFYTETEISGVHDMYFVLNGDFEFDEWQFI